MPLLSCHVFRSPLVPYSLPSYNTPPCEALMGTKMFGLSDIGLLLDIGGAFLLAQGLIFKPLITSLRESQSMWGANLKHLKSLREQVYDARVGLALLLSGFLGQLIGAHYQVSIDSYWFWGLAASLLVIFWLVHIGANHFASADVERAKTLEGTGR
jgi:hypothetical protein